jgi:subtilisin family serine protease
MLKKGDIWRVFKFLYFSNLILTTTNPNQLMKQNYTSSIKCFIWIFLAIVSLGFSIQSAYAQSNKIYANSPDGRVFFELSESKMLIKFDDNVSFETIQKTLQQEPLLKKITKTMVLPSPKNAVLAEITKPLSFNDYNAILKRLELQPSVVYAHAFLKYEDGTLQGITNRVAVKLKSTGDYGKLDAVIRKNGLKLLEKNMYDPLVYFVQVPKNSINPLDLANQLAENGQFAWAEVDFLRLMNRFNTNDTFLANQWSLNNTGSALQNNGTPGADMRVFNAWGISTGANIKVAIIDEGVDLVHPDLAGNMLPGFDGTGLGSAGAPSGNDAHGTACAGIVAAVGNNSLGVAGVAYSAKIIPIRIAYSSGSSWITTNAQIGTSIDWAWNQGGADVLSNSWGGGSSSALINDPITRATTQGRGGLGAPVLFAAGNNNGAVSYPATLQNVISVVAMSMCNQRKNPASCDGETFWGSNFGTNADIAAPGVKIYTSDISGAAGYSTGDYTATFNGTSSACPNAAGVMALILSVNPGLTNTQARQIIESSCEKVGGYTYTAGVANQPNGTWSTDLGHGRVNAFAALQLANPQPCINPPALATALASPSSVCGSGTVSLSLNGATFGSGQTYQWQSSPDNTNWTNISGQTGQSATAAVSTATWFRCLVTCGATTPSTGVQVTINDPTIIAFPHTQNFDASGSLPCGWTTQNVNADPRTWNVGATSARSAPNNIVYAYSATLAANDWIFTPPLNLVAGENYRVRFWYRARSATYAEKLEVKWGATASATGMTSAAIFTNSNIINTAYVEGISTNIVATTSGIQYIGFRVFSDLDKYDLYIDDITIETISACTVPTVAGTITGPTTGNAGTSISYSYSGGNGTAINWQSAAGAGAFADISGATTNSLSLNLTPGTYQVRARISKSGCNDEFSNVINLTINPKVGDNFSLPIVIGSLPYNTSNSNAAGSGYSSTYTGTNQQASADIFYQFTTGSCTDSIVISTCTSSFDTYIHLLSSTGTWIASNDDNGPSCTGTSASLKALVLPNTTYYVVVEGYTTSTGSFNLAISQLDNPPASASITADGATTFCAGGSVNLSASEGSSYAWSNGATTQSISVNATGNYSVTVTDANGCSANASQDVTVNELPTVSISADGATTFCAGGSVNLSASEGSSYVWSNGATTQSISVNASGSYSVTVTDANGCSANASQDVTVNELPTVSISADGATTFCAGGSVNLTASEGSSYAWSNGATTQSISVNATGNYSVTVTDVNGCSASASQGVTVNELPTVSISADGATTFCAGGSVNLTASEGSSYVWSNGATTQSISVNATGNYSVTVTDVNGCSASASQGVTVNELPTVSISADGATTFCAGGSVNLTASEGSSYVWSNGATTQSISVNATGNYSVTVTDANGCSASVSQGVTVNELTTVSISADGATTFCAGGSVNLTASEGSSYVWSNGATTQSISVNATGNYSVTVTDANGCSANASQGVTVNELPVVSAGTYSPVFTTDNVVILAGNPSGGTFSGTGVSGNSFNPGVAGVGTFTLTYNYTDGNGCSNSAQGSITVTQACNLTAGSINGPTNSCAFQGTTGGNATYSVSATDASSYTWTLPSGSTNITGQGTNTISFKFSSTFTTGAVSVVIGGCSTTTNRSITVTRATPATPTAIIGTANICAIRGTAQTNTYSIAPVANAISYTWVAPANTVIISGQGTTSITLQVDAAFTTGSITVRSNSGCANSSTRSFALSSSRPGTPGTITGTSRACPGNTFTYSVVPVANTASYNWTVPTGATIVSGAGTNSIQVSFDAGFIATGTISVTATNGCGTSAARTYSVARNTPGTPSTIVGQTTGICGLSVLNYSVTNVAGMTYTWTAPAGTSILSGQGSNAISLSVSPTFVSGTLAVNASNNCSTSANRTASLITRPNTPASITGLATAVCIGSQQTYTIAALPGATSYTWTVPASYNIVSGQGTNSILVNVGTANGSITARGNNACGAGSTRSLAVTVANCAKMAAETIEEAVEFDVFVSPNPFNETLNIRTNGANDEKLQISIVDVSGRIVYNQAVIANETINISPNLASGIYYVSVTNSADVRKLIKVVKAD